MRTAFGIGLLVYTLFVFGFFVHCILAWRDTDRLHRMAQRDKERQQQKRTGKGSDA